MRLRSKYLVAFVAIAAPVTVVASLYYRPRQQTLSIDSSCVGTYYGLGWHNGSGLTGKNWFHIRCDEGSDGWWEVEMNGYGYAPYRGYYADGTLKEQGVCMVEINHDEPMPNRRQILDGKYYDPASRLAGEIKNSTGCQTLFYANGVKSWEMELRSGRRVFIEIYWPSGHRCARENYDDQGAVAGSYTANHADGTPRVRGSFAPGRRETGVWLHFHSDGSLAAVEDFSANPPARTEYEAGVKFLPQDEIEALDQPVD